MEEYQMKGQYLPFFLFLSLLAFICSSELACRRCTRWGSDLQRPATFRAIKGVLASCTFTAAVGSARLVGARNGGIWTGQVRVYLRCNSEVERKCSLAHTDVCICDVYYVCLCVCVCLRVSVCLSVCERENDSEYCIRHISLCIGIAFCNENHIKC